MMQKNYIHSKKWTQFLQREQEPFLTICFIDAHGEISKKVSGFGFKDQLHYYKDGKVTLYRTDVEYNKAKKYYDRLAKNNKKKIMQIIEKEHELRNKISKLHLIKSPERLLTEIKTFLAYNTCIPRWIGNSLQKTNDIELFKSVLAIRKLSFYEQFMDDLICPLIHKAAKIQNIPFRLATKLTPKELIDILKKKKSVEKSVDIDELKKREKGCFFYKKGKKIIFIYSPNLFDDKRSYESIIKGMIACKGIVKGRVRIINSKKDFHKIENGDILISNSTNPTFIPVIKKAAAIITEEGGVTSHAAIISRELKIPCLIGVKNATTILKNDDLIKVDAYSGLVKIISRKV